MTPDRRGFRSISVSRLLALILADAVAASANSRAITAALSGSGADAERSLERPFDEDDGRGFVGLD
jgi:hypothetical protein